jgi:adenylate kinase family enzyme
MKIHITGASGSGVTTLGQALSQKLSLPYFDNDNFYWEKTEPPFTTKRPPDVRNSLLKSSLEIYESWILGGSMLKWNDDISDTFDLIIFLWIPPEIRIERLKRREFERYGDVIFTNPERRKAADDFLDWAASYDDDHASMSRTRKNHEAWLATMNIPVLRIEGDFTVVERIELVENEIKEFALNKR